MIGAALRSIGLFALFCAVFCALEPSTIPAAIIWLVVATAFLTWRP